MKKYLQLYPAGLQRVARRWVLIVSPVENTRKTHFDTSSISLTFTALHLQKTKTQGHP